MTQEEAQQLIAEINKQYCKKNFYNPDMLEWVEKIIIHFANKIPECGLDVPVVVDGEVLANMNLKLNDAKRVDIKIRNTCDRYGFISFDKKQLIVLRDNCNKILEYLGDE